MIHFASQEEYDVDLIQGGPLYSLLVKSKLAQPGISGIVLRACGFIAVTFVPLVILTLSAGNDTSAHLNSLLFQDIPDFIRFIFVGPLLLVAEPIIQPWLTHVVRYFTKANLISDDEIPKFNRQITLAVQARDSILVEIIMLALAFGSSIAGWTPNPQLDSGSWHQTNGQLTSAGMWFQYVSMPLMRFLWLRWLWRYTIWSSLLARIAALRLQLVPTHPDLMAGLAFVSAGHSKLGILAFAASAQLAANIAQQILFQGDKLGEFKFAIFSDICGLVLINLLPLLVFTTKLADCKRIGLYEYGILAKKYVDDFANRWIYEKTENKHEFLGHADISGLADLGQGFSNVRNMQLVAFDKNTVLAFALAAAMPFTPLLLTIYPFDQLVEQVVRHVL